MAPCYGNNGQLSRDERVQLYGILCEDQVTWSDWTPGVESVCDLVLQNVFLVTQEVKFKLPPTKEFDMPYPEPFKLAPGMRKSIPISFRPSKYEPHVDQVQIITKAGSFFVTVKATVKDIALFVPPFIDFGLCPTSEKSETQFEVYNTGTLKASVRWHAKPPFTVRSPGDTIDVGQSMRCVVEFEPQTASVFDALVVCEARDASSSSIAAAVEDASVVSSGDAQQAKAYYVKSTGVGKMPHLCVPGVSSPEVHFGDVFPGTRTPKALEILNTTPVRASFSVRALHDRGEILPLPPVAFSVSPESGVVEPHGKYTLTFYFQSHTVKEHACQRFQITTPGGIPLVVKCAAFSRPMDVRLSTRSINFGEIPSGTQKVYSHTLQIHNDSDRPAPYHFINVDNKTGVFSFDRPHGTVPANSFMVVSVFFGPLAPINYYKLVSCVVKGALAPLTLHLMGSVHTEKSRPARLEQKHVDIFQDMQLRGVKEHPPPSDKKPGATAAEDELELPEDDDDPQAQASSGRLVSATQSFLELMLPADSRQRDIALSVSDLDFGSCSTMTMSEKKIVTITNRTSQKVCVTWMIPGETRMPVTPDDKSLLGVYPSTCDIAPRGSHDFAVSFRPSNDCSYEGEILEAVVYQKVNRTFRLVDLEKFTPPWTVAIKGVGHTMGVTRNDPRLDLAEGHIRFRACHPGERTYQVAMLTNPGDTTISYRFLPPFDATNQDYSASGLPDEVPFRVWPTYGVIPPHQFHLVALEFAPTRARNENAYVANFQIVVDYNEGHPKTLRVSGRAWEPKVTFCRGQSMVTFPPTCSGIASSMECMIRNVSEIPITYECRIPSRFRKLFWFETATGELLPSESSTIVANFCPNGEKVFSAPLYCMARCIEDPDNSVHGPLRALMPDAAGATSEPSYVLQFVGHGKVPAISLEPDELDLGAVRACDEVSNQVVILNSSNLAVHFTISSEFLPGNDELPKEVGDEALQLGCPHGKVAGRCTEKLNIVFRPPRRGLYQYRIVVTPKGDHGPSGKGIVLMLKADVQYPSVQIADLRTEAATLQPQSMMWMQFQVDGINTLYSGEVSETERRFQAAIGIDEKKKLVAQLKPFQLLFGTSAAGSTPTVVYLTLTNPSRLKVRFCFQTPKDLNLENAPYWCDEKALTDDRETHFSWVEEHSIYDIQPRNGEILPGDFLHVKMTYHHHSIGTHILPVVFNVHDGRSVLMYLKAHSVAPNVGCLSVRSSVVSLQPVPLNVEKGTTQPVELTNSGCIAAPWRIDLQSIFHFNLENYDFEVLSVYPVEGVLEPQSSTFVHFTFTPLETKGYVCPVRVEMLKDGRPAEELLFELRAEGYDPEAVKPETEMLFPANLPIQTYAPVPGCGAALSIEILDFGCCPLRAWTSRILVLVNYTSEYVLSYRWEPRQLFKAGVLQIEPSCGELSPESHCIIVFRVCCDEPVDVSGEIACFLEWTHISAYGQSQEVQIEDKSSKVEYLAFHSDHVHEKIKTGKHFMAGEAKHISVANRLTISRFRNLMSTASGQKFLNENLHRTALLSSHLPTMNAPRPDQLDATCGQDGTSRGLQQAPPPTANPLYVRVRVVVADWDVPPEKRDEFLVLNSVAPLVKELTSKALQEEGEDVEIPFTRKVGRHATGGSVAGMDRPQSPGKDSAGAAAGAAFEPGLVGGSAVGSGVVAGVLEHMLREIISEDSFGFILDNMLAEQTPYFVQYEDSVRPGEQAAPLSALLQDNAVLIAQDEALSGGDFTAADDSAEPAWRSDLLMDFEAPPVLFAQQASAPSRPPRAAAGVDAEGELVVTRSPSTMGGAAASSLDAALDDSPQRYWEEALRDYGEVDLEVFRRDAGEVLEGMLLDMVDDVIAGRLNWMRPLPRPRNRR